MKKLRRKVQAFVIVWADQYRRVPVEAKRVLARLRFRLDTNRFAGLAIETPQVTLLRFRVDDVWIFGIDRGVMTIATDCFAPIPVADAANVSCAGRAVL